MKRQKYSLFIGLVIIFSVLVTSSVLVSAHHPSLAQKVGDEYIWQNRICESGVDTTIPPEEYNTSIRVVITKRTTAALALIPGIFDLVKGDVYYHLTDNQTWQLLYEDDELGRYNPEFLSAENLLFVPQVEIAANCSVFAEMEDYFPMGLNYSWTSGASGYDGVAVGWEGSVTGDEDAIKMERKYDEKGVLEYWKTFEGNGSGWELVYHVELSSFSEGSSGIPAFSFSLIYFSTMLAVVFWIKARKSFCGISA